jgi:hypothetical protein
VDRRVEPPSWLPGGAASSDAKGPGRLDPAADGPDSEGPESQGPVSFGQVSGDPDRLDLGRPDPADVGIGTRDPATRTSQGFGAADTASTDTASTDTASTDTASTDPGRSDPAPQEPADGGFSDWSPVTQTSAGEPPGPETDDVNAYSYAGETSHSNGQDAGFGPERASVGAYSQQSGYVAAAADEAYSAQFADTAVAPESTAGASRRTAAFSGVSRPQAKTGTGRGRRADLVVARFEPWSVMKFSFLISLVAWVILFVAVALLYFALSTLGVFDSVQRTLESVTSSSGSAGVSLSKWFSASRILGYTMLIGAVNIVLITALSTVGAMVYNLVTHLGGGIEVTLRETD